MLIYRILSILLYPLIELYLLFRVIKKKEDKQRLRERFGCATQARPEGHVIWLHAVSVGEANSALILVDELLKFSPEVSILFTTTTLTSASIIAAKLPQFKGRVIHQFLPVDSYFSVQNFLTFWHPRAAIFVESEIWPNLIYEARNMGIPAFLVNGRMSEKSTRNWRWAKKIGCKIFDYFATIIAQTAEDQKRFQQLTDQPVLFYGNLKSQAQNLFVDEEKLTKLKQQIKSRKLLVAASTHKGEEEIILRSFDDVKKEFPDLLLIIIPRHPNRIEEIKLLLRGRNFVQRSKNENIAETTEIYLADSLGELGIFYSLANFAFIGGSFLPIGGHNPFEAIKLNCAVISAAHVFNFKEIYHDLTQSKSCIMVNSAEELTMAVKNFLNDEEFVKNISSNAARLIKNSDDISKKIVTKIDQILMFRV